MIDGLKHELCETVTEPYVYKPFKEYAKQVKVKSLILIVNHWISQILISGVETSEDDKFVSLKIKSGSPGNLSQSKKLASNFGQP